MRCLWKVDLLNPAAEHDCDILFLDLFIKTLQKGVQPHEENADGLDKLEDALKNLNCKTAQVKKEIPTTHGNLDNFVESPQWGVIVIENKTKSGERDDQICVIGEAHWVILEEAKRRKFQEKNKGNFEHLTKQLHGKFPEEYDSGDRQGFWWPFGFVQLHKEFMTPQFLAKNATQNSEPMPKQIAAVVEKISDYFKILEKHWPQAGA